MQKIDFTASVPVRYQIDLCIVGAGPAGVSAAIMAARQGIEVLLIEAHSMAGGMSTAGMVPVFMPYSDGINILVGGVGYEIIQRLGKLSTTRNFDCGVSINPEHLKRLYEEMLLESGAKVLYYSRLAAVQLKNREIEHAIFSAPSGLFAVKAKVFIDATGDGSLAAYAGAEYDMAPLDEIMPSTLCSLWAGVDFPRYITAGARSHNDERMLEKLSKAFAEGTIKTEDYHHTGIFQTSNLTCGGNLSHVFGIDPTNEESLSAGIIENRRLLAEYEEFYRREIDGFENAEIVNSGSLLGVRESRRIRCDYTLVKTDHETRRTFDDEIGRYNFPADIHPPRSNRQELECHKRIFHEAGYGPGESYGIPYRVLLPRGLENILVAGRCVSTDRYVHASIRVMPGCYITGQAAGMAAALAAKQNKTPRGIDVKELRFELQKAGAFFK